MTHRRKQPVAARATDLDTLMREAMGGSVDGFLALPEVEQLSRFSEIASKVEPSRAAQLMEAFDPLLRARARDGIAAYISYLGLAFRPAQHHRMFIEHLETLERREFDRLIINVPPGSAKSTYGSTVFPAWYLGRHPTHSVVAASHTQDLMERFGRRARNIYGSPEHQRVFGAAVAKDSKAAGAWETSQGGEYFAAGVGGAIAGHRGDLGLIDDPFRSIDDAYSQRTRDRVWDWYKNDFEPRLKPEAIRVLIMNRLHDDDLAGRVLQEGGARWRVLKIPMEARAGDPLGRRPGERLWPEWFTAEMVADAKSNPQTWNALYQQEPAGEDGDYFKRDWFRDYDMAPSRLAIYGSSDYAVTERAGDFTEHGIFGIDTQKNIYVLDWWSGQESADVWIEAKCDMINKWKPLCWFGEAGVIRRSVEPFLLRRMDERNANCRLEWLPSEHDKGARCRAVQALCSMGKVWLPKRDAEWASDLLGQLLRFPAGVHDDKVDAFSLMGRGLEYVRAPEVAQSTINLQTHANVGYESAKRRRLGGIARRRA